MSCEYIYKDYRGASIEEVISAFTAANPQSVSSLFTVLDDGFVSYKVVTDLASALQALLKANDAYEAKKSAVNVTSISELLIFKEPSAELAIRESSDIEFKNLNIAYVEFRKLIGTDIHEALAKGFQDEFSKYADSIVTNIQKEAQRILAKLSDADKEKAKNSDMFKFIKACANPDIKEALKVDLGSLIQTIKDLYKDYKLLPEFSICLNPDSNKNLLKGRMDLVLVSPEGKIKILDFKTSDTVTVSQKTINYQFGLYYGYKKILTTWGFKDEDISFADVPIKYGVPNPAVGNRNYINYDKDKEVNIEELVDGRGAATIRSGLNVYFPIRLPITEEEIKQKTELINKLHEAVCDKRMLYKHTTEALKALILNSAKEKKRMWFYCADKTVELLMEGDDTIIGISIKDSTEEVFRLKLDKLVEKEQKAIEDNKTALVVNIVEILSSKNLDGLRSYITYNTKYSKSLWGNLYKYFSYNWEYQARPDLELFGIICMKNTVRNTYEYILLVPDSANLEYSFDPNANILDYIITDKKALNKYLESQQLLRPSIGNFYLLRAALAISELSDLKASNLIENIKVVSLVNGSSINMGLDTQRLSNTLHILLQCCVENPNLENSDFFTHVYSKFKSYNFVSKERTMETLLLDSLEAASVEEIDSELNLGDWKSKTTIEAKLEALDELKRYIENHQDYKKIINSSRDVKTGQVSGEDPIIYIYNLIGAYSNTLLGLMEDSAHEINSYGISFKESVVAGINLLAKAQIAQFTKTGLQLTGLALGLLAATAYASPSKLIQRFQSFYNATTALILYEISAEMTELNTATQKFIEKSNLGIEIYANHDDIYSALFLHNGSEINLDMLFLNPYSPDSKLAPHLREYLEVALWTINRHRITLDAETKKMSYELLKKSDKYEKYKDLVFNNSTLLEIPLKLRSNFGGTFTSFVSVLKGKRTLKDFAEKEVLKFRSVIEHELLDDDLQKMRDAAANERKYKNYYKEGDKMRIKRVSSHVVTDWEWNINKLCADYALADLKDIYFNKLLKVADNQMATISILEMVTGLDLSKLVEALHDRIKVSIYNKTLVKEEFEDVIASMGVLKTGISLAKIAVRPALFIKEMLLGRIRNTAAILTNQILNDSKITFNHLLSASKEVFGPNFAEDIGAKLFGSKGRGEKTLVDLLNDVYAINDRDLAVIAELIPYDRYGLHNFGMRMLYLNTIAPDWFNRMIIMVAKMKADGTWEAHKNVDCKLVYDPSKDERIKEFWNNKEHPKNTAEYKKAEAFYILRMQLFEREGWKNPDGSYLNYSNGNYDPFPRCYTTQEEDSLKELIGLIYGYYSHQERANMQKGLWWTMYTQFLTFLPAEIRKYLAVGAESSIVQTIQEVDPVSKKPLYWKETLDSLGDVLHEKTTEPMDEKGNHLLPVLVNKHSAYEGLLISTAKTVGLVCRGDFEAIKENPLQLKNVELFCFNTLFAILIAAIIGALSGTIKENKLISALMAADTLLRVGNELNFYHSVIEPVGDFGLVGTDFLLNTFTRAFKVPLNEDYSLLDFADATFSIVKDTNLNMNLG